MPADYLKDILSSGRAILGDTKVPKPQGKTKPSSVTEPPESDPHKIFIKKTINEKPPKKDVVEQLKRFCKAAEDEL